MVNGFPDAEIYEANGAKLKNPVIFAGFVGAGLAGTISVDYIINKLDKITNKCNHLLKYSVPEL